MATVIRALATSILLLHFCDKGGACNNIPDVTRERFAGSMITEHHSNKQIISNRQESNNDTEATMHRNMNIDLLNSYIH